MKLTKEVNLRERPVRMPIASKAPGTARSRMSGKSGMESARSHMSGKSGMESARSSASAESYYTPRVEVRWLSPPLHAIITQL